MKRVNPIIASLLNKGYEFFPDGTVLGTNGKKRIVKDGKICFGRGENKKCYTVKWLVKKAFGILLLVLSMSVTAQKTVTLYVRDCGDNKNGYEKAQTIKVFHCKTDKTYDYCVEWNEKIYSLDSAYKLWRKEGLRYKTNK